MRIRAINLATRPEGWRTPFAIYIGRTQSSHYLAVRFGRRILGLECIKRGTV